MRTSIMDSRVALLLLTLVLGGFALREPPLGAITVGQEGQYSSLSTALQDTSSLVSPLIQLDAHSQ